LSGLAHHLLPRGDLNLVVIVIAAAVDALHDGAAHLLRVAAIAITLLAKMIAEIATGTMIVTVAVIGTDHAVPTHGKSHRLLTLVNMLGSDGFSTRDRDRDLKDDRDDRDRRENGANGDDRKGTIRVLSFKSLCYVLTTILGVDSPQPAHDELDAAE
jgi:hypothetical protein